MNRTVCSISVLLLLFATILSCEKPSDDAPIRDLDKLRISKITQSTASAPQTTSVIDFFYDNQQRVDKIVYANGNGVTYYYNGTEKNPYKASGAVSTGSWIADIYYTYNNAGILIRDSAKGSGTSEVITHDYMYSSDKIIVTKGNYQVLPNGMIAGSTLKDSVVVKNNNIAEVVYATGSIGQPAYYYQVSYDNKINPISKLNIAAVKVIEGLQGFPDNMAPGFCKNNITSYTSGTISYSGTRTEQGKQSYTLTYTKEGLPETCTIKTQRDTYTYKYTYEEF